MTADLPQTPDTAHIPLAQALAGPDGGEAAP